MFHLSSFCSDKYSPSFNKTVTASEYIDSVGNFHMKCDIMTFGFSEIFLRIQSVWLESNSVQESDNTVEPLENLT